jgi:processive 1,2-diacylglycerol beta-glucosyltransferase
VLLKHASRIQAILICGREQGDLQRTDPLAGAPSGIHCYIEGYSEAVHLLMQVSNVIVTRGGTTTVRESPALSMSHHFQCVRRDHAAGRAHLEIFSQRGKIEKIESAADFARIIDLWMRESAAYPAARENFLKLRYEEDPTVVIDELVKSRQRSGPREVEATRISERRLAIALPRLDFAAASSPSPIP